MAKYTELCTEILEKVGGKENMVFAAHCMTRLRVNVKDKSKIDVDAVKKIKGVLGAQFAGDQFQIIIGQHVSEVYPEFCAMAGVGETAAVDENLDGPKEPFSIKAIPSKILDYISGSIASILTVMVGCGWFKLIYSLLGPNLLNLVAIDTQFMRTLYIVGEAGFYFMPVFVAYGCAKKLNTNIVLSILLSLLLIDPKVLEIVSAGEPFKVYGLFNMPLNSYTSSLLPTLLTTWVLSYVYKYVSKYMPNAIKIIGIPLCTLFIMVPLMFCVLAPVGTWIGTALSAALSWLYNFAGPVAIALIGGFWMYLVATGMHMAIIQIAILNIVSLGYDPVVLAGSQQANLALMGMAVAYFLRAKGEEKQLAATNAVTLIIGGISEPTLFSLLLRNKKAMVSYTIGGLVGGLIVGLTHAAIYTVGGASNILCLLTYAGGPKSSFVWGCIAGAISFAVSFAVGLIIGFGTPGEGEGLKSYKPKAKKAA